ASDRHGDPFVAGRPGDREHERHGGERAAIAPQRTPHRPPSSIQITVVLLTGSERSDTDGTSLTRLSMRAWLFGGVSVALERVVPARQSPITLTSSAAAMAAAITAGRAARARSRSPTPP